MAEEQHENILAWVFRTVLEHHLTHRFHLLDLSRSIPLFLISSFLSWLFPTFSPCLVLHYSSPFLTLPVSHLCFFHSIMGWWSHSLSPPYVLGLRALLLIATSDIRCRMLPNFALKPSKMYLKVSFVSTCALLFCSPALDASSFFGQTCILIVFYAIKITVPVKFLASYL